MRKENDEDNVNEVGEDATKYGEFVSSYFAWIPLPKQKERANELDKMTKKNQEENINLSNRGNKDNK